MSNGLLFNEAAYQALMPGAVFIKQVSISVDAGNEKTYALVRGGDWAKLLQNLKWIGEQKKKKIFRYFQMNFTVRADNFESIPEFIQLATELGVSNVKFTALFDYVANMGINFEEQAIHLPRHPRHHELRRVWESMAVNSPGSVVRWSLPVPTLVR